MSINILFLSENLLVIDKPVGIAVECPEDHGIALWKTVQKHHKGFLNCHRIDKNTSGLIVFATDSLRAYIMRNWHNISYKSYLAIILNPTWNEITCNREVETDKGLKSAITTFRVLDRSQGLSLIQCELTQNGRKHQIRQHLAFLGHPILGDLVYGGEPTRARQGQLLHAHQLSLDLPGEKVHFQAPIPKDFKTAFRSGIWSRLDQDSSSILGSLGNL